MNNWSSKILTITILGFFAFSLVSMEHFEPKKVNNLQSLIAQTQKLEESSEDITADFKSSFYNTITILQEVAGLQTIVTTHSGTTDSKTVNFIVQIKSPFFFHSTHNFSKEFYSKNIPPIEFQYIYKSHIVPPDTPPPNIS